MITFKGVHELERNAKEIKNLKHGHITVSMIPSVAFECGPAAISNVLNRHSGLSCSAMVDSSPGVIEKVSTRQADVGICNLPFTDRGVRAYASFQWNCMIAIPKNHELENNSTISIDEILGYPFVSIGDHSFLKQGISQATLEKLKPVTRIETHFNYVAGSFVAQGAGMAIVDPITARSMDNSRLSFRPLFPPVSYEIAIICSATKTPSRLTEILMKQIDETLRQIWTSPMLRTSD